MFLFSTLFSILLILVKKLAHRITYKSYCYEGSESYTVGQKIKKNCNTCECRKTAPKKFEFVCENKPCLIQPKLNDVINRGNYGWRAANYSFFWGRTLEYGIRYRLGTFKPYRETMHMNEIRTVDRRPLPESFDSRRRWPRMIQEIRDQGECGSSWAFSSSALASDRRAIQSRGRERITLSPQHLISCNTRGQQGCEGGHIDRAWWFLRNQGLTSDQCYPYTSGHSGHKGHCRIPRGRHKRFRCPSGIQDEQYRSTPPYRVGPSEEDIMHEIYNNGPVQATFRVMQDFFSYSSGIYRKLPVTNTNPTNQGWHSVRIIGWGVEKSGGRQKKYWVCANSWGTGWGEDGYFRINRGQNECDIETFIVGVWAKRNHLRRTRRRF
ncbi:uncharacterized peptidase C1-like protein F26E4.3 isoform X1 [Limulus polyphemus]|uniref:Uncharacterized peptidase C1-like protein F26E4.3 isoform X1 n=1 Tax=Limulus polyphemus TaxID=6850 RepID=A0ABM1T856_LIMPO|nr:uncharacterized peptidase C1-like protein F26E4.3 isoform X1 [Limulus polyphemus]